MTKTRKSDDLKLTKANLLKRAGRTWYAERLDGLFETLGLGAYLEDALELIKHRRLLDFSIFPGRLSAKIQEESGKPIRTEIIFEQFSDETWETILEQLASQALFLSALLSNELPAEIESAFEQAGVTLFPRSEPDVRLNCDCSKSNRPCAHLAALFHKFSERFDQEPFSMLVLRGRGREETLSELRRRRVHLAPAVEPPAGAEAAAAVEAPAGSDVTQPEFFTAGEKMHSLSYSIRADELPAAILKWLDPIPAGSLSEEAEMSLEEAYAQVARRAQAYGLGFHRSN